MKFITKRHTARVIQNAEGTGLDLELIEDGQLIDGEEVKTEILKEDPIPVTDEDISLENNRLVSHCLNENFKTKKIAVFGQKVGDIVKVACTYLVE
jgi:hypothetical protein